jgi:hypothetical protein
MNALRHLKKRHRGLPVPKVKCAECDRTIFAGQAACPGCVEDAVAEARPEDAKAKYAMRLTRELAVVRRSIVYGRADQAKHRLERVLGELDPAWRTFA